MSSTESGGSFFGMSNGHILNQKEKPALYLQGTDAWWVFI